MSKCILTGIVVIGFLPLAVQAKGSELEREKAELMGRVEDVFLHNFRDVTWRKSVEWGDVTTRGDGLRSIQYTYEALIWGKEHLILSQVFTFAPDGECLRVEKAKGFPRPVVPKKVDLSTQEGLIALVEDFFSNNYRDISARNTISWGEPIKDDRGNVSIRYKYEATFWGKDTKIVQQLFTFDPQGSFVSVKEIAD